MNNFLSIRSVEDEAGHEVGEQFVQHILTELQDAFGSKPKLTAEKRIRELEELLRPTFVSLPKNKHGGLDHTAVRYTLHQFFLRVNGWRVRGLEPAGEGWNVTSPTTILADRVPAYIQGRFESRLGERGLGLHEVALLAATLENLVQDETLDRLEKTFSALGLSSSDTIIDGTKVEQAIHGYLMSYIMGTSIDEIDASQLKNLAGQIHQLYPGWNETRDFARNIQQEVLKAAASTSFADATTVVSEIGRRYGRWQDRECQDLKRSLVAREEEEGSGRVSLVDFYKGFLHGGQWGFSEGTNYLRQLGALDESEEGHPRIIVANYLASPTNCLGAASGIYTVCCLDECTDLMAHIEQEVAAPSATAERIAAIVSALPSASRPSNRTLSAELRKRLDEVADYHGGEVPLHGRLFAQWMHHAYPRECVFPHVSGTTKPRTADVWMAETGLQSSASKEEMLQHADKASPRQKRLSAQKKTTPRFQGAQPEDAKEETLCLPWTMEEELIVQTWAKPELQPTPAAKGWAAAARHGLLLAALVSILGGLARALHAALSGGLGGEMELCKEKEKVYSI